MVWWHAICFTLSDQSKTQAWQQNRIMCVCIVGLVLASRWCRPRWTGLFTITAWKHIISNLKTYRQVTEAHTDYVWQLWESLCLAYLYAGRSGQYAGCVRLIPALTGVTSDSFLQLGEQGGHGCYLLRRWPLGSTVCALHRLVAKERREP